MADTQRNFYIDYIKGIASLSVVLLHCMPNYYIVSPLWIGQAVPLFLFITGYLTYSSFQRGKLLKNYYSKDSFAKVIDRIFKPFFFVLVIQVILYYFLKNDFSIKGMILSGGIGPGSYYPWIYLQAWFFLPLIIKIIDRVSLHYSFIIFLIICLILEILSSFLHIPEVLYRLAFYRYIFLLYLACIVKKFDIKITFLVVSLAIIGAAYSLFVAYTDINLEPFFYFSGWRGHTWISYFYTVLVFLLLKRIYFLKPNNLISNFFILLGKYSYEIFLCQMFVFSFITLNNFSFENNIFYQNFLFIISTTSLSIIPVIIYKKYLENLFTMNLKKLYLSLKN
ncbi:acyltransferase family protein [Flavobacterium sp. UBA4854]|uniref:acyltransferase family protein n=1 Tax=Flavobacterium sp. UBA4854 TaxID=1946548 RepID=UPI00257A6CA2|nr:acyltransferase family protein [Flavobacterium sp. UBA4854]